MQGQWFGDLKGTATGKINLDVDECRDGFEGVAYVEMHDKAIPDLFFLVRTPNKIGKYAFRIEGLGFVHLGVILSKDRALEHYADAILPDFIDTEWEVAERKITVKWKTNIDTFGEVTLRLNDGDRPSQRTADEVTSWSGFKSYVSSLGDNGIIFRGQEDREWRLRTAFHREKRANVYKFANEDIQILHKNLCNLTDHLFDLDSPVEFGAFVSMVQHHGYPTPLLDWTYSPFIAAYFAFNDTHKMAGSTDKFVRVHAFDKGKWTTDFPQIASLKEHKPHFSVIETLALNNPRMIPQQALATVTNVADIETYIQQCEEKSGRIYLRVFDIPMEERSKVLKELRMMGITSGSLFPGLDGACREIRSRLFEQF